MMVARPAAFLPGMWGKSMWLAVITAVIEAAFGHFLFMFVG
jgi:hypothetical protein